MSSILIDYLLHTTSTPLINFSIFWIEPLPVVQQQPPPEIEGKVGSSGLCCGPLAAFFGCKKADCVKEDPPPPTQDDTTVNEIADKIDGAVNHTARIAKQFIDDAADFIDYTTDYFEELLKRDPTIVIRREIRSLPEQDQIRFVNAVKHMMKSRDGIPGTSPYFNIAVKLSRCNFFFVVFLHISNLIQHKLREWSKC